MSKWTPGEWKMAGEEPFVYALNEAGTNRFFCSVQSGWITDGNKNRADDQRAPLEELQANARLMRAAPEMAALLKRYLKTAASPLGMSALAEIDADARILLSRIEGGP